MDSNSDDVRHGKAMREFLDQACGSSRREYPHGRVGADDDGVLNVAMVSDVAHNIIRVQFAKPTSWIGLDKDSAVLLRDKLTVAIAAMWPPEDDVTEDQRKRFIQLARESGDLRDGELEVDDDAKVSIGENFDDDGQITGAYVAAWLWVDSDDELGTELGRKFRTVRYVAPPDPSADGSVKP